VGYRRHRRSGLNVVRVFSRRFPPLPVAETLRGAPLVPTVRRGAARPARLDGRGPRDRQGRPRTVDGVANPAARAGARLFGWQGRPHRYTSPTTLVAGREPLPAAGKQGTPVW